MVLTIPGTISTDSLSEANIYLSTFLLHVAIAQLQQEMDSQEGQSCRCIPMWFETSYTRGVW